MHSWESSTSTIVWVRHQLCPVFLKVSIRFLLAFLVPHREYPSNLRYGPSWTHLSTWQGHLLRDSSGCTCFITALLLIFYVKKKKKSLFIPQISTILSYTACPAAPEFSCKLIRNAPLVPSPPVPFLRCV